MSAARRPESLATRREAVELLSCDAALIAYLVQNSAISRLDAELIERETASSARQNITLLRCVDWAGRAGLSLLLNALRLTGQHQLANLLDYTPRIVPLPPGVEPTSCTPGQTQELTLSDSICLCAIKTFIAKDHSEKFQRQVHLAPRTLSKRCTSTHPSILVYFSDI